MQLLSDPTLNVLYQPLCYLSIQCNHDSISLVQCSLKKNAVRNQDSSNSSPTCCAMQGCTEMKVIWGEVCMYTTHILKVRMMETVQKAMTIQCTSQGKHRPCISKVSGAGSDIIIPNCMSVSSVHPCICRLVCKQMSLLCLFQVPCQCSEN